MLFGALHQTIRNQIYVRHELLTATPTANNGTNPVRTSASIWQISIKSGNGISTSAILNCTSPNKPARWHWILQVEHGAAKPRCNKQARCKMSQSTSYLVERGK
jgi:hypothetical protein